MVEQISNEEIEALFLAQEFISQIHDASNISKLFVIAMTLPIDRPNSTFNDRLNAIKMIAERDGMCSA